jgi:hypothetical protein
MIVLDVDKVLDLSGTRRRRLTAVA